MRAPRISSWLGVSLVILVTLAVNAQEMPDFSGTWTPTSPALSADSFHTERIEQKKEQIIVVVQKSGSTDPFGYSSEEDHTYTIGGPVESKKDAQERVRAVAVSWGPSHRVA